MNELAENAAAATALVVCKDAEAQRLIIESLKPLAIRAEICGEVFAAARLLDKQKFEAVIVDLLLGEGALLASGRVCRKPSRCGRAVAPSGGGAACRRQ